MHPRKIVITGGGTGGHVFPAIALALELRRRGHDVTYVGSKTGFESRHVPKQDILFVTIQSGAVKNQSPLQIAKTLLRLSIGFCQALFLLLRSRPAIVIGVGGYVSVPVSVAAVVLGVKLVLQEQNVSVGLANRFLGRVATHVYLGFEQAMRYFPAGRTTVTGNPIRPEFADEKAPYRPETARLLILGGSQGAGAINAAVVSILDKLIGEFPNVTVIHQTGERDLSSIKAAYEEILPRGHFEVTPFITDVASAYQSATLVLARSGALTVSELLEVKRPAILVPYPRKGQNDQTDNANHLRDLGVADVVEQGENFPERLWTQLKRCLQPSTLEKMHGAFSELRRPNALVSICDRIESTL